MFITLLKNTNNPKTTIIIPLILGKYFIRPSLLRRNLSNIFINSAVKTKGIPIPMEYIKSIIIPLETVSAPPAYIRIEAKTGPKQGVHPAAKAIPM